MYCNIQIPTTVWIMKMCYNIITKCVVHMHTQILGYQDNVRCKTLVDDFNLNNRDFDQTMDGVTSYGRTPCCHKSIDMLPNWWLSFINLPTQTSLAVPPNVVVLNIPTS